MIPAPGPDRHDDAGRGMSRRLGDDDGVVPRGPAAERVTTIHVTVAGAHTFLGGRHPRPAAPVMDESHLDVGGRTMRCLTTGQGKPMLLCHGFLSSAEEFGGRFGALAEHRRLIIPDLPGNGESAPLATPHTVDALAASLEQLLDQLDVDEFDVAGLCLGASVAAALTRRCGRRVSSLVLHTPLLGPSLVRRTLRGQIRLLTFPPLWRGVVALSRIRIVSDLYKRYVIAEGDVDAATANINFDNQRRADPAAAREWLRDSLRHAGLELLLEGRVPTLVILAGHDQVIDVARLRQLIAPHAHAQLFVDAEQGHGWNQAAVERQTDVMLDFFDARRHTDDQRPYGRA